MMNRFLIIMFLLTPCYLSGQRDSIQKAIMNYGDSKSVLISKGRSLLLDKFLEEDFIKIKEIKDYLISEVANNDYAVFYPLEYWLILYWTREYNELIEVIKETDSLELASFQKKIKPLNDLLFTKVRDKSRESKAFLIGSVSNSELKPVDKEFLKMNLNFLLSGEDYTLIDQDYLNNQADDFLNDFPDSDYEEFTRKYIRFKYRASNWGMGMDFFTGYGIYTGSLSDAFRNHVPIGIAFDISYKRLTLYLRDYISFNKSKLDISYPEVIWPEGSRAQVFLPEASLGYVVADSKKLKLTPFAGISAADISPSTADEEDDPGLEDVGLEYTTTWTVGLNLDLKMSAFRSPLASTGGTEQNYWFIRFRYAFNLPQFTGKYPGFDGNIHYLVIGVGGFGRRMKRDY